MAGAAFFRSLRSQSKHLVSRNLYSVSSPCRFGLWLQPSRAKPSVCSSPELVSIQRRFASSHATGSEDESKIGTRLCESGAAKEKDEEAGVVYHGPISSTIKKVKLLSLTTCCLSVALGPVVTFMTSPGQNVILKGVVASSVIFFSASTTGILHWFASPYIHRLRWQPGSESFEVEMLSLLAKAIPRTIKFADIRLPETNRPFVTFKAYGKFYFIDTDNCDNKALLARLVPQKVGGS